MVMTRSTLGCHRSCARRLPAVATAAAALVAGATLWAAVPARASATGCTVAPDGNTCIKVNGTGLHVDSVRVSRNKVRNPTVCDYYATVTVSGVTQVWRSGTHQGCGPYQAWMDFAINRDFADGSVICGRFFEGDKQQGGAVCETIHR
jgi:hypothetical protein